MKLHSRTKRTRSRRSLQGETMQNREPKYNDKGISQLLISLGFKNTLCLGILSVFFVGLGWNPSVYAGKRVEGSATSGNVDGTTYSDSSSQKDDRAGHGHDVPTPFGVNQVFELASGEQYLLAGQIVVREFEENGVMVERAFLKVDLTKSPWLASSAREKNPHYLLAGSIRLWNRIRDRKVYLHVKAQGQVVAVDGEHRYEIFLRPINYQLAE